MSKRKQETTSCNEKNKKARIDESDKIKEIRDRLNLPDFWIEQNWCNWTVYNFDEASVKHNPAIGKYSAHLELSDDLKTLTKVLLKSSARMKRIIRLKRDLKVASRDPVIADFWRKKRLNAATNQERRIAETRLITATLNKETQAINRKLDERNDNDLGGGNILHNNYETYGDGGRNVSSGDGGHNLLSGDEEDNDEDILEGGCGLSARNNDIIDDATDDAATDYFEEAQSSLKSGDLTRHELFRWAFKLQLNHQYEPSNDIIDSMRALYVTDLDNLNRMSISIMEGWHDADELLEQI
ncbi:hypothetical protein BDA99DRAFT_302027 [Phascolomyces articulosus]|uniref:Uncharacterized protein n=1 Tax=Phascolomyces articulosus TaxID=60185 RepID=A0AAD5PGS5_9FUNG|nr:hypothetical protein BDA99DRAFT_302027 [Phascolomyces articulosus]